MVPLVFLCFLIFTIGYPDVLLSWPQFTLRPEVLVRVRQVNTKVFKFPFMSKLLFLSKPCTRSLISLDTESTPFIGKF